MIHPPTQRRPACIALLLTLATLSSPASSPSLSIITPRGGQRGTEIETVFQGDRLGDAKSILFYEPGIQLLSLDGSDPKQLKARLKIDDNARLGQHTVRVATATGISEARTLSVGQYPITGEQEPNNDFANPQKITLNSTIHGVADNEDIDYYIFEAKTGQRITAEVEAMRLGSDLVDCHVAILDLKRFELASCDDSSFALQDPVASVLAPADGTYVIAVRESSYAGSGSSRYCLHLGEAPRPLIAYPAGGKAGQELEIKLLGDIRGPITQTIKLPDAPPDNTFLYYLTQDNQSAPSPNKLRVVPFDNVLESEPNDSHDQATPTDLPLPLALNGIIEQEGDVDIFRFKATKGNKFEVRCIARNLRSPLDSVLRLHDAKGKSLENNDDSGGPDSSITWTVPEDGEYAISVRDHLGKGGPHYVYRVEFLPVAPSLNLGIPSYARNSQERNSVSIPRGNRYATLINIRRSNFGGPVQLSSPDLPKGVTMASEPIDGSVNEVPVVFEASADAETGAHLAALNGQHAENKEITGGFKQTLELIYGAPNNTVYYQSDVDRMAIAVTEEAPFKIQAVQPKVPLVQNGSMNIKVLAERKEGFNAPIKLQMLWNPPGIGSQNEIVIGEGQTEALYPINASGGASTRNWKIAIVASSDPGNGTVWTSSQLVDLTVAPPFVTVEIPLAAGEQGQNLGVLCKLQQLHPFDGEATIQLHGLPPKVALAQNPLTITTNTGEIVYNASLETNAPTGQHKSLFCQVIIMQNGEPITHNVGSGGVLRIDAPPPPKKEEKPEPKEVAAAKVEEKPKPEPQAAPPKPLSRLQKLRLEAKERAQAGQQ